MKGFVTYILFLMSALVIRGQQFPQYTQFMFNKIGYNPAASGVSLAAPFEIIMGARTQWIGLSNNPKSQFVSMNYNFVPQRSYKGWHNVGMYVDQDQNGIFSHNDVWLSYTYHLAASRKFLISAGLFAGIKQYKLSSGVLDPADPAVKSSRSSVIAYPDLVPGIRLSSKKFFMDLSLQQISIYKQKGIGGQIGSPSKLSPHYNFSIGRKIIFFDINNLVIAANLRGSLRGMPSAEITAVEYVYKRVGFGVSVRSKNYVAGILQFRLVRSLVIGMAYDLSINKSFGASPHNAEIMIGLTPVFNGEVLQKKESRVLDECTF